MPEIKESFEIESGIVSIPNTEVWTTLLTITEQGTTLLETINVILLDPAGMSYIRWRLTFNGVPRFPFSSQTIPSSPEGVRADMQARRGTQVLLQAWLSSTSVGAFDVIGRIKYSVGG